tara:strand:- start:527 stop:934 length:408 start_codon:yes stop_codon:yes gene_type:complete
MKKYCSSCGKEIGKKTKTGLCIKCYGITRISKSKYGLSRKLNPAEYFNGRKKQIRKMLVEENGGKCCLCGYDKYTQVLDFHHLEPDKKEFELGVRDCCRSIKKIRDEAKKCVLLCANCHREVGNGFVSLDGIRKN